MTATTLLLGWRCRATECTPPSHYRPTTQSIHRFTLIDGVKCMSMRSDVSMKCIFSFGINFLARCYTVNILEIDDHRCFDVMESNFASGLLWPTEVLSPMIICSRMFTSAHLKTEKNFPYTGICILHSVILDPILRLANVTASYWWFHEPPTLEDEVPQFYHEICSLWHLKSKLQCAQCRYLLLINIDILPHV